MSPLNEIYEITAKLKSEGGIGQREADWVYSLASSSRKRRLFKDEPSLADALRKWYDAVIEQLNDCKEGRFITTAGLSFLPCIFHKEFLEIETRLSPLDMVTKIKASAPFINSLPKNIQRPVSVLLDCYTGNRRTPKTSRAGILRKYGLYDILKTYKPLGFAKYLFHEMQDFNLKPYFLNTIAINFMERKNFPCVLIEYYQTDKITYNSDSKYRFAYRSKAIIPGSLKIDEKTLLRNILDTVKEMKEMGYISEDEYFYNIKQEIGAEKVLDYAMSSLVFKEKCLQRDDWTFTER